MKSLLQYETKDLIFLLFPLALPLPIPLNIKSFTFILFIFGLLFHIPKKELTFKNIFSEKLTLTCLLIFALDPVLSLLRGNGLYFRELRLILLIAPAIFFLARNKLNKIKETLLNYFVLGTFLYIIYALGFVIIFFIESSETFGFNYFLKYITYHYLPNSIHHTYLGMYFCLATAIIMFHFSIKFYYKIILSLIILFPSFILISKFGILVLFTTIISSILVNTHKKINRVKRYLILSTLLFVAIIVYLFTFTDLFNPLYDSVYIRAVLYKTAFNGILSNPFIGIGNYAVKPFMESQNSEIGLMNSHNIFLGEFLSNGVLGFVSLLLIFYIPIRNFSVKNNLLELCFFTFFFLFGLIEHLLNTQNGILFIVFFLMIFNDTTKNVLNERISINNNASS